MVVCGCCSKTVLNDVLSSCKILSAYAWLIDAYVLDFFTEDLWQLLPSNWQEVLVDLEPHELGLWLDPNKIPRYRRPWPLSLLALRSSIHNLSIPRRKYCICDSHDNERNKENSTNRSICSTSISSDFVQPSHNQNDIRKDCKHESGRCNHFTSTHRPLGYIRAFQKHVKPKKRHEIFKMAKVVCEWADKTGISHVVDVGSGVGHLARLLSYGHYLSTCCIESQSQLSSAARKLDEELEYTLSKYLSKEEHKVLIRPIHVNSSLGPNIKASHFIKLVSEVFCNMKKSDESKDVSFGIVGLHPCGDLAATLLNLFIVCPQVRFICIAGCCYMKLTPGSGFPLSQHIIKVSEEIKDLQLSYEAREMACHAIEMYSRNLLTDNHSHLKIHCYRATLESIIAKNWPHLRRSGLRSIKYTERLQFSEYAKLALSSLELIPPVEDLQSSITTVCLHKWRHVVIFYSLRLMFAPLVESFLLYDRLLYLTEKGFPCRITPEFDPDISPRNHLLIGFKLSSKSSEDIVR